ncbi:hypothetical protein C1H46_022585 [Malus baccata]|uniref:Ppx/GppA phosphatase C-terminal domain-containing protein n=1 Tax=Malus baccata TaxID=106549 RepID=A0A540LZ28_MALBA|nr:hypothetical protein C1H46_022585 [Malus baccata]
MASPTPDAATLSTLLAAIDMGTNSFKLLIVRAYPDGIFFTIGQFKEPVVLGRDTTSSSSTPTPFALSHHSHLLALESLKKNLGWLKRFNLAALKSLCGSSGTIKAVEKAVLEKAEMFEALRKCDHLTNIQVAASLDAKDLEYLEAACVLHNIGISVGKKGYHKHSCSIITKGNHLHGYSTEEVKEELVDHVSFKEFPGQACSSVKDQNYPPGIVQTLAEDFGDELRQELAHFKMAFQEELYIVVPSSASE